MSVTSDNPDRACCRMKKGGLVEGLSLLGAGILQKKETALFSIMKACKAEGDGKGGGERRV